MGLTVPACHVFSAEISAAPGLETSDQTRLLPPYKLLLLNDDIHSMDFVVEVLVKVMKWDLGKAVEVMLTAHHQGQAILLVAALEVVELKHEQVASMREGDKGSLRCVIEPA